MTMTSQQVAESLVKRKARYATIATRKDAFAEKAEQDGAYAIAYALMELCEEVSGELCSLREEIAEISFAMRRFNELKEGEYDQRERHNRVNAK